MTLNRKNRMGYIVSSQGGIRATSRRFPSLKKSTISDVLDGKPISKQTQQRIDRVYLRVADEDARERERQGKTPGTALVDEATARRLEQSLRRQGFTPDQIRVTVRSTVVKTFPGVPGASSSSDVVVAKGRSVDGAKENLNKRLATYEGGYAAFDIEQSEKRFRIYVRER